MKEIRLSQNKVALVDDEDFNFLNQHKWSAYKDSHTFYATGRIHRGSRKQTKMHHAIIGYPTSGYLCDHIDGNGLNNQRHNLRFLTPRESCLNRKNTTRVSKYPGVVWLKKINKWQAQMRLKSRNIYLGIFSSEEEAFKEYSRATGLDFGKLRN